MTFFLANINAIAGSIDGPYVIWFNLSKNPAVADLKIRQYVNSGKGACWDSGAILFMRDKPKAITQALVARAVLQKDPKAIKSLNNLLALAYSNEAQDGFDGIVVYTDKPFPSIYSLTTGHRHIKQIKLDLVKEPQDLELSFCSVLPPITRLP